MTLACHQCGSAVQADDLFCRACGARQRSAGGAADLAVGDRRQLTVMFCDLVGSTAMAARLDPEDVQMVLRAFQQVAADLVGNVDGHIAQYLGDGVLVYLGYPAAHEDDPVRAISAALEIVREVPRMGARLGMLLPGLRDEELRVRVGIHTGPVVIGAVGSAVRSEQLASGSTVNLAARLSAEADPGSVMISESTARRARGVFAMEALGERRLKGLPGPVVAFRPTVPLGMRSRLAIWNGGSGRLLVGREALLARLSADWAAVAGRRPGAGTAPALLLRGEAGIGKSRLVQALRQQLAAQPHGWIACHGAALQTASAFYPITAAVRASLDFDDSQPLETARASLDTALTAVGLGASASADRLAVLLGLAGSAARLTVQDRNLAIVDLVEWWRRLAREKPLVVALEDLHWFDPSSLEVIAKLMATVGDAPIQIVGTLRPEWQPPWPDVAVIDVPPLPVDQISRIISDIVGPAAVSDVVDTLIERADGVPLYAEELAHAYLDHARHVGQGAGVPASLQDLMMARLDRLGVNKRLVQLGALLGRTFSHEMIGAVSELDEAFLMPSLAEITASGIVLRDGVPPRANYTFRHALLQDAAADSLLRQQYRQDNAAIAKVLIERFPEIIEADPGRVAQHYAEAGEVRDAINWYRRAGLQAKRRAAYGEAETAYYRAIALAETLCGAGEDRDVSSELYGELGRILQLTHGYAAPSTLEAITRAKHPDREARDSAFLQQEREVFQAMLTRGAYGEARACIEAVTRRWQGDEDDADYLFFKLGAQIQISFFTSDLAAVELAFAKMVPWIESDGRQQPPGNTVSAIGIASLAAWWRGEPVLARDRIAMAEAFAEATRDPYDWALAMHYLSQLHLCEGDAASAAAVGARLLTHAQDEGFAYLAALVRGPISWAAAHLGTQAGNAAVMRQTLDALIAAGARIAVTTQLNRLAEVHMLEGSPKQALATVEQALVFNPEERIYRPASLLTRARIIAASDPRAAEADLAEALALATAQGALGIAQPIAQALAELPGGQALAALR